MGRGVYWYFVVRMGCLEIVSTRVRLEKGWLLFGGLVVLGREVSSPVSDSLAIVIGVDVHCAVSSTPKTVVYLGVFISVSIPPRLIVYCTR
jgi:hypothetical protein